MSKKGIKPKHHAELNKSNVPAARLKQLRVKYKGDDVAQQQIDRYDGNTEYHDKLSAYIKALRSNDMAQEGILAKWFKKFFLGI